MNEAQKLNKKIVEEYNRQEKSFYLRLIKNNREDLLFWYLFLFRRVVLYKKQLFANQKNYARDFATLKEVYIKGQINEEEIYDFFESHGFVIDKDHTNYGGVLSREFKYSYEEYEKDIDLILS